MFPVSIPPPIVFSKKTFASYPCAKERAHRRRYEAVLEIAPKLKLYKRYIPSTNSIVSIT